MKQITDRQLSILNFISNFNKVNNYPPTVREIAENFGITLRAVQDHVTALQKKAFFPSPKKKLALSMFFLMKKELS